MADARAVALRQLYDGAQRGDAGQVQALLTVLPSECIIQIDRALTAAVRNDHADTVAVVVAMGLHTCLTPCTALLDCAARHGSVHVVPVLVAAKASIDGADLVFERPLCTAAVKGQLSCISLLAAMKAHIWVRGANGNALHEAALGGHTEVVECLLRAKADHNQPSRLGETPVYLAAARMHEATLRMLLDARADVNPPQPCRSPLFGAAQNQPCTTNIFHLPSVFRLLLGARADVNATTALDYTALSTAVAKGCPDAVVKLLLRAKADVNVVTAHGITALHFAARDGRRSTAHLLVRAKADVRATSTSGKTAETIALRNRHFELAEYLKANAGV
jgi:ankyrin repeat protein